MKAVKLDASKVNFIELSRKQVDINSLRVHRDKFNWALLSMYRNFTMDEIDEFKDLIQVPLLFKRSVFSEEIADSWCGKYLDWENLVIDNKLSISQYRKYKAYILDIPQTSKNDFAISKMIFSNGTTEDLKLFYERLDFFEWEDSFKYTDEFLYEYREVIDWDKVDYDSRWSKRFVYRFLRYIKWDIILTEHLSLVDDNTIYLMTTLEDNFYPYLVDIVNGISDDALEEMIPYLTTMKNSYIPHSRKKFASNNLLYKLWMHLKPRVELLNIIEKTKFMEEFIENILVNNFRLDKNSFELLDDMIDFIREPDGHIDTIFANTIAKYAFNPVPNIDVVQHLNDTLKQNIYTFNKDSVTIKDYEEIMKVYPDLAFSTKFINNIDMFIDIMIKFGTIKQKELLKEFMKDDIRKYIDDQEEISNTVRKIEESIKGDEKSV